MSLNGDWFLIPDKCLQHDVDVDVDDDTDDDGDDDKDDDDDVDDDDDDDDNDYPFVEQKGEKECFINIEFVQFERLVFFLKTLYIEFSALAIGEVEESPTL